MVFCVRCPFFLDSNQSIAYEWTGHTMVSFVFRKEENELDERALTLMSEVDGRLDSTESMLWKPYAIRW